MPEFIYQISHLRPTFPGDATPEEIAIVQEHADYLGDRLADGSLILTGRTQDDLPIGICIFEAENEEAARHYMQSDPAVAKGLFQSTLRPYGVFLMRGKS